MYKCGKKFPPPVLAYLQGRGSSLTEKAKAANHPSARPTKKNLNPFHELTSVIVLPSELIQFFLQKENH